MSSALPRDKKTQKLALLLTGGGARAAYQIGVLKAIAENYPRTSPLPFDVLCGTSAGALNATGLACYASCFHLGVKKVESVWRNFHTNQVYHSDYLRVGWHLLRGFLSNFQAGYATKHPVSLVDNKPLKQSLTKIVDLNRIDRNIQRGFLSSISVTASCYNTGESITFFQSDTAKDWRRAKRSGQKTLLGTQHLMASAAIPLLFPSVQIHQQYYGDGSVNQLSPLSAPIHLGAERIFIIGLEPPRPHDSSNRIPHHPGLATVAGHLLDTVFADTLTADLERLDRINVSIETLKQHGIQSPLKKIDRYLINPSVNFNQLSSQYFLELPFAVRSLLKLIGISQHSESSLTSYLLFEKAYTRRLIALGMEDAKRQMPAILEFLQNKSAT